MTRDERTRLVWGVRIGCLAWMAVLGYVLFVPLGAEVAHHGSAEVKDRMASECLGSFKDRYDCKEAIIVQSGQDTFVAMAWRFLLVVVPPLAATLWLPTYLRRHPLQKIEIRHDDGDWKSRAQGHVQMQAKPDAEADDKAQRRPPRPHIADIAPVDDWKAKAQSQINKAKRPE